MHEKMEHLFAQKTRGQNKLPLPLSSLHLQILLNINLSTGIFTITLIVTFNFLFILFDCNIVTRNYIVWKYGP